MPKFFVESQAISSDTITILPPDAHHIARSLRMAVGDKITVSDNTGVDYECELVEIRDEYAICRTLSASHSDAEPPIDITLYMAYPKSDKLETVVQKAVELGATAIVPFESSRCIKRPKEDREEKRCARLQRIATEAAKQCGRSRLPRVERTHSFGAAISAAAKSDLALFCYEGGGESIRQLIEGASGAKTVSVIVGSEGGFSPEEAALAREAGLSFATLGRRILRCETAPLFALSALSCFFEL
ncbi:MAG: 16S rRNA (uracil(1498)-N(3))-methyltransferase [Clostridia bacterium]|nr:16S rRNA (uracil(1498)-N(3))-methyltransferase [Clostridia bacterium]